MTMNRPISLFYRSAWFIIVAILSPFLSQTARALQLPKAIEVRLMKSSVDTALKSARVPMDTLPVIERSKASHLWVSVEIEGDESVEYLRILTTMPGSRRQTRSRPELYFGQLKTNAATNAFGSTTLFNIERLGRQGRLQRIDLGVFADGDMYVHAIKLTDGRVLTPAQIYSVFATVPNQPIEVRFLKFAQESADRASLERGLKFKVIETSQLSWLLIDHLSAPQARDDALEERILMMQTTSDEDRVYGPWQTAMDHGRVGCLEMMNLFGLGVLQNLKKMAAWGLLRRIDFGVRKHGGLYVYAVQLQSGETLTQEEIALALIVDDVTGPEESVVLVNFYFAQMVLSKKSGARFGAPIAQTLDRIDEASQSRKNAYVDFPSFAAALAADRDEKHNIK